MVNKLISNDIKKQFLNLVKIPSSSGKEKRVGKYIISQLSNMGWHCKVDGSGLLNESDFGNVIAYQNNKVNNRILFVAHIDTVQKANEIVKPVFADGVFKSDGTTILGADNKASVAVLLSFAKFFHSLLNKYNPVLAFTTREENGFMGSRFLNIKKIKPNYIFNLDGSAEIGTVDFQSLGQTVFELHIYGKAVHSTGNIKKGVNALIIGAKIITVLKMGKSFDGTTLNIGMIKSGFGTNIIPDYCFMKGEIRGMANKKIKNKLNHITRIITKIVKKMGGKFKIKITESNPPFISKNSKSIMNIVQKAMNSHSIQFKPQIASYTSDSSYLSQNGIPTVTICKGGKNPHSLNESVTLTEMEKLYQIIQAICYYNNHD